MAKARKELGITLSLCGELNQAVEELTGVLDVYEARRRLGQMLAPTPLLPSSWLSSIADGSVHLKLESLNLTHSFKIRGAMNRLLAMTDIVSYISHLSSSLVSV